jgi:condensin complex subunit 1
MKEGAEAEILSAASFLHPFAGLTAGLCHQPHLNTDHARLQSSALLSMCKLMAVNSKLCDQNLQLLFTLLHNRVVEAPMRSNMAIAIGDLALRFPNVLEPWTEHIYQPLGDPDVTVGGIAALSFHLQFLFSIIQGLECCPSAHSRGQCSKGNQH